jgi:hypothetical protein
MMPGYKYGYIKKQLLGDRDYGPDYLKGELDEFHQALAGDDPKELDGELQDCMYALQMLAAAKLQNPDYRVIGADGKIREFLWRRDQFGKMFKARGVPFSVDYLKGGSNIAKPEKIQRAFEAAGSPITPEEALAYRDKYGVMPASQPAPQAAPAADMAKQAGYRAGYLAKEAGPFGPGGLDSLIGKAPEEAPEEKASREAATAAKMERKAAAGGERLMRNFQLSGQAEPAAPGSKGADLASSSAASPGSAPGNPEQSSWVMPSPADALLRRTWGADTQNRIKAADKYNEANGFPYRMADYNKPTRVSVAPDGVPGSGPNYDGRTGVVTIGDQANILGGGAPSVIHNYDEWSVNPLRNGLSPRRTLQSLGIPVGAGGPTAPEEAADTWMRSGVDVLGHEVSHAKTVPAMTDAGGVPDAFRPPDASGRPLSYVEQVPLEWTPAAGALNRGLTRATGKGAWGVDDKGDNRQMTPEEYQGALGRYFAAPDDDALQKMLDEDGLTDEEARAIRYRRNYDKDPARQKWYDETLRRIAPGVLAGRGAANDWAKVVV